MGNGVVAADEGFRDLPEGLLADGPDGPDTSAFQLDDFVTFRLAGLAQLVLLHGRRAYAERFGLSIAQWRILALIARAGETTLNELADRVRYDKSQISRAITALVERGAVNRMVSPTDLRSNVVSLTEAGRALYEAAMPLGRERQRELLALLTPDQRREFYTIIDILTRHLRAADARASDEESEAA
jgi:DNA-binding MarR family transcriptional regulator